MGNAWPGRRVLVTGANGFAGSWLAKRLVGLGAKVIALVRDDPAPGGLILQGIRDRVTLVRGDLTDYLCLLRALNEYGVDTCFHLGAQAIVDVANRSPISTFASNIQGTWNLLEACRNAPTIDRVVVASSDKAYGDQSRLPYVETDPLNARFPYDVSKACAELIARSYFATYGLPVAVTKCANLYGGGDLNFARIVPDTLRSVLGGRRPIIRSDGTPVRDYLYVADAVEAYVALADALNRDTVRGEVFNFGTGHPVSVLDLVTLIVHLAGRPELVPEIRGRGSLSGQIQRQYLSSEKAAGVLGWSPVYSLNDGLRATIDWYRAFLPGVTSGVAVDDAAVIHSG